MKISKTYEANIMVGNFQSIKVGITIHSDKEITGPELPEYSAKLGGVCKKLVSEELAKIKQEHEASNAS
jgi:hypothetical protein